ncbi:fucolectin-5-like [Archocentrus centrarchus]|uniref:fucolectin-5-like n=1 Tax=Archocentrus centrarchus TaxID=63155 RepID=UPI0011EA51C1|nr:fucolectin-5-like [Archocentrus centrarchus]
MLWSLLFITLIGQSSQDRPGLSSGWEILRLNDKSSFQSSVYTVDGLSYSAGRAFDGDLDTCSHTEKKINSWWTVDLLGLYEISCITVNNGDHHNIDLTDARILIGNSSEGRFTECATITTSTRAENKTFNCVNGTKWGRYVTVYKKRLGFIILCEVMIQGTKKGTMRDSYP